jgi:hypothetical protein
LTLDTGFSSGMSRRSETNLGEIGDPGILRYIFSMDLADSGHFHRAVARLYHQKDNSPVRALNKALFYVTLGEIGDLWKYSTSNLSTNIVDHR